MGGKLPKLNVPFLEELYHPDHDPARRSINRGMPELVDRKAIDKKIKEVEQRLFSDVPKPLTEEEAGEIEQRVKQLRGKIATTRGRIKRVQDNLDKQAAPDGQPELSFSVNLKKKGALRRAVSKAFGIKPTSLTYSMYKAALAAKRDIEESESSDYTSGNWEDE